EDIYNHGLVMHTINFNLFLQQAAIAAGRSDFKGLCAVAGKYLDREMTKTKALGLEKATQLFSLHFFQFKIILIHVGGDGIFETVFTFLVTLFFTFTDKAARAAKINKKQFTSEDEVIKEERKRHAVACEFLGARNDATCNILFLYIDITIASVLKKLKIINIDYINIKIYTILIMICFFIFKNKFSQFKFI
ncbi:hypothetical protein ACJX0J_037924, partial [Zea mays]